MRIFDTAPFYGAGLSEFQLGRELAARSRDDYLLSTKVGRLIPDQAVGPERHAVRAPDCMVYDYSAAGTFRSIEDSLQRLNTDRLDFVWVHDIAQDFHGDAWLGQFEVARVGAFRALSQLRTEGVIGGWGLAVNRVEPVEVLMDLSEIAPDANLLGGRYTLLDHKPALQRVMPTARALGLDIVVGGPYSSGFLEGRAAPGLCRGPIDVVARVESIKVVCDLFDVPIKAAALQFCLAHPAVAAVLADSATPALLAEDYDALTVDVPGEFWHELRARGLVGEQAPLPIDRAGC